MHTNEICASYEPCAACQPVCSPPFCFCKIDAETRCGIAGAVFELQGNAYRWSATSDPCGVVRFPALRPGTYQLTETAPPPGYTGIETVFTVTVDCCGCLFVDGRPVCRFSIPNTPTSPGGTLRGVKFSTVDGRRLSGAVFELRNASGVVATAVSSEDGRFSIGPLSPGRYTLVETQPPSGFLPVASSHLVEVAEDGTVTVDGFVFDEVAIGNTPRTAEVLFQKRDAATGLPLSGVRFELVAGSTAYASAVSDENGIVNFGPIVAGTYRIRELSAPAGYLPLSRELTAVVAPDGSVTIDGIPAEQYVLDNTPLPDLTLNKDDGEGRPLSGARYRLSGPSGSTELATDDSGTLTFASLSPGVYTLTEISPPNGFEPDPTVRRITVREDGVIEIDGQITSTLRVSDRRILYDVRFIKRDALSGNPLAGAVFELFTTAGPIGTAVSDNEGAVDFGAVAPGSYLLRELTPPSGYDPDPTTYEVVVSADGSVTIGGTPAADFTAQNLLSQYEVSFTKRSTEDRTPVAGAQFELSQGSMLIASGTSDSAGRIDLGRVAPGSYTLRETAAAPGFLPYSVVHTVEVSADGRVTIDGAAAETFVAGNTPYPDFAVYKVNENGLPLAGARFELRSGSGVYQAVSDTSGYARFPSLAPGAYTLTELSPPPGYQPNGTVYTLTVGEDGSIYVDGSLTDMLTVTNFPTLFDAAFSKRDFVTGTPVTGAQFELRSDSGAYQAVSDTFGYVRFGGLFPGFYTLTETSPAPGYLPHTDIHNVYVDELGNVTIDGLAAEDFVIGNRILPSFTVHKTDPAGVPTAGAQFTLYRGGTPVQVLETGVDGNALFDQLEPGVYTLMETAPPPGFDPNPTVYTVTVGPDGSITIDGTAADILQVTNTPSLYALSFLKINADSGATLAGARFALYQNGSEIASAFSDANGFVDFGSLPAGAYTLRETQPPEGFSADTADRTVLIGTDGSVTIDGIPSSQYRAENLVSATLTAFKYALGAPLPGAVYELTLGGVPIATQTADQDGRMVFTGLRPGDYQLREVSVPAGYMPVTPVTNVTVLDDGSIAENGVPVAAVNLENRPVNDVLRFVKLNGAGQPLASAEFTLYDGTTAVRQAVSDANGVVDFGAGLAPGTYTLRETRAPDGFAENGQIYQVVVDIYGDITIDSAAPDRFSVQNKPLFALSIRKYDRDNLRPLEGAVYQVRRQDGTVVGEYTTNIDGLIELPDLEPGEYTVTEIQPPPGYRPDPTIWPVTVTAGTPAVLSLLNERLGYSFYFRKIDRDTGIGLPDAWFELIGPSIYTAVSDGGGFVRFDDVLPGYYQMDEIIAPPGYLAETYRYDVEVLEGGQVLINGQPSEIFEARNFRYPSFRVLKVDQNGQPLPDAQFQLLENGQIIQVQWTGPDGLVQFEDVPPGFYRLVESVPPAGYRPDPTEYEVYVDELGHVYFNGIEQDPFIVVDYPETLTITGQKRWVDRNPDHRPSQVRIVLYQNGVEYASILLDPRTQTDFEFTDLPIYDENGVPYDYTVDEVSSYPGYEKTVEGTIITNTLRYYVLTVYYEDEFGNILGQNRYLVPAFSSFTVYAPALAGYHVVSAPEFTVDSMTSDMTHTFYYARNISTLQAGRVWNEAFYWPPQSDS
ncbi:SpaA isopeptide-forming pilin-related protein [Candidatus Soleaferrea massiliensis]|uniref:SpaA isopeptide-forming pilin-related protein n=1 Tax=Candidatus Soleaferrea massiliensis TaxID=1470354 RepID=UPI00058CA7BF|nr:SpaA isopeptide-forming pilin-related protein [Candidatus Soleaferrea massiliensis]